ncbi:hypothetical protein [Bartonella apis]|uniref:hypothetical protein n=1 Tax=Bartonella apis TaxID=1686310 RepID=UPI003BB6C011
MSLNAMKAVSTFCWNKIIGSFKIRFFYKNWRGFFPLHSKLFACTRTPIQIEIENMKLKELKRMRAFPALYFFSLPFELHLLQLNSVFAALSSFFWTLETIDKQTHHPNWGL